MELDPGKHGAIAADNIQRDERQHVAVFRNDTARPLTIRIRTDTYPHLYIIGEAPHV